MIELIIDSSFSLQDLLLMRDRGYMVIKTPHVGNQYMNNLIIAVLGFDILVYDRNIGSKDKNFHPQSVILESCENKIFQDDVLVTHAKKDSKEYVNTEIGNIVKSFDNPTDLHNHYFSSATKNKNIKSYSDYILKNREIIFKILKLTEIQFQCDWYRYVNIDGSIVTKEGFDISQPIFGVSSYEEGWIIPNIYNILFHCVLDQKDGKLVLLSGPDMYKYIAEYGERLNAALGSLRDALSIPEAIQCIIVPVSKIRFAIPYKDREVLDQMLSIFEEIQSIESKIRIAVGVNKSKLISDKVCSENTLQKLMTRNYQLLESTIFYDIGMAKCYTQYDLCNAEGLYIPDFVRVKKISEINNMYDKMSRYFKYSKYVNEI